jgi:predicted O-methyltransferase YrrM
MIVKAGASVLHFCAVAAGFEKPQTQTTQLERNLLVAHLPGKKRIVEIGVFEGFTTHVLAQHADPDAIIYGVDPFFKGRLGVSWGYQIAKIHNADALQDGRVVLIRALSVEVGERVPSVVDFVFVDADHSFEGIRKDWVFWTDRISSGGIIALHDSFVPSHNPRVADYGSHKYFESHIRGDPRFELISRVDSLALMRRLTKL